MSAPLKPSDYPKHFILQKEMLAFTSPTTMYKIHESGSNSGCQGVVIDYYITRNMVLRHYPTGGWGECHVKTFKSAAEKLFRAYISKMTDL